MSSSLPSLTRSIKEIKVGKLFKIEKKEVKFIHCLIPVIGILGIMVYGMGIREFALGVTPFPLEVNLIIASIITFAVLVYLGFSWKEMEVSMVKKIMQGLPSWLVLLAIGAVVGSWIISGIVPMLVYYGVKLIDPAYIYLAGFLLPIIFSMLTGTSFGSVGTIGVVVVAIGLATGANMPILAGAIISGAFFGDKMSPLSDTTNLAAMVSEVDLYDHIKSMMNSTVPATIICIVAYLVLGNMYPPSIASGGTEAMDALLFALEEAFNFNILLLLPLILVLVGAFKKMPSAPIMFGAALLAVIIGYFVQDYTWGDIAKACNTGFNLDMVTWVEDKSILQPISGLARGGLQSLLGTIIIAWLLFAFMGLTEVINAMPVVVGRIFGFAKGRFSLIISTLISGIFITGVTGHIYASIMLPADIFKDRYDALGIPRTTLSRSLEDAGTFMDPIFPWTGAGVYMSMMTGVSVAMYTPWLILIWSNLAIAVILAATGWTFFGRKKK